MEWQYDYPANEAIHTATKTRFQIRFTSGTNEFAITPIGSANKLPDDETSQLVEALRHHVTQEIRRRELRNLIAEKCGNDLTDAARAISLVEGKTVTTRTIQSWLIDPTKPSSRSCPEWAISALREKETPLRRTTQSEPKPFHEDPQAWVAEVRNRRSLLIATEKMEQEEKRRIKWKKVPAADFPVAIANSETELWGWIHVLEEREHAFFTALKVSSSFDEFKKKALEMREAISMKNSEIQQARLDVYPTPQRNNNE